MLKLRILFLFITFSGIASSQNIFSALHLNEEREYKTKRPKKIVETNVFHNSSGKQIDKNVNFFDDAGMLLKEERYNEEGTLTARLTYSNDTVNRLKFSRTFERWNIRGYSNETAFYYYDSSKFLVRVLDGNENGKVYQTTEIMCNERGLPIQLTLFDGNGSPFGKEVATYSYEKNRAYTSVISNDGRVLSNDSMTIRFIKTNSLSDSTGTYNANGDLLVLESTNLDGTRTVYEEEYEYDKWGNCIENKIYEVISKKKGKRKRKIDRVFKKEYTY
jgi:hypothetical protein